MLKSSRGPFVVSAAALTLAAVLGACTGAAPKAPQPRADEARTQGGARVVFTSLSDWNLKGENLSPRGRNPYYFPLAPGFRYIMEHPEHPWGHFRLEVIVLEETEAFDVPGLGRFECAVVREEEFIDGIFHERSHNWFCMDRSNGAVYAFGEVSWEIDKLGRKVFVGTWRVGEPDGNGVAEPGMLMPADFEVGARYVYDGHEAEAYGYAENLEAGITAVTPARRFEDCVKVREHSLTNPALVDDKVWCRGVGLVTDTADGMLIASDAVPESDMSSFGIHHRNPVEPIEPPIARVNGLQATQIALEEIPGEATTVKIERFGRRNVYAVEIVAREDGSEWDVFVDMATGEVVATDH